MTKCLVVSPWCKRIGITLLSTQFVLAAPLLAQDVDSAAAVPADKLKLAAEDAASCRELRDPNVRLACLDAAADRLAEALDSVGDSSAEQLSMDQAERDAGEAPTAPDTPAAPVVAAAAAAAAAPAAPVAIDDAPNAPAAVETSAGAAEDLPEWAAAPEPQEREDEKAEDPRRFEATIVRITRNNVGRHRFFTADGAVWEQTQLVEVRAPKSLPAKAEFNRKLTGNPTIKLEGSNRSYRVRRVE